MRKHRHFRYERLERRELLTGTVVEHDNVGYFFNPNATTVERYDIEAEQWLSQIRLEDSLSPPTVAHIDADGFYVAYDTALYRYDLDGRNPRHILNTATSIKSMLTDQNLLFVVEEDLLSIDKRTNTVVDTYAHSRQGFSISPSQNRLFMRGRGSRADEIYQLSYDERGHFDRKTNYVYEHYRDDSPPALHTWVFPHESKLIDSAGTIHSTGGLRQLTSLGSGSPLRDVDFLGGETPIVLGHGEITAYSAGIVPTGTVTVSDHATEIFVNDRNVIVLVEDTSTPLGYDVQLVPVSMLNAGAPGTAIDPVGLPFIPDKIEHAKDGQLLLFSAMHESIFRWDPVSQRYTDTIPLSGVPTFMSYSASTDTIYLAYQSREIRQIDLNAEEFAEVPFVTLQKVPLGLSTAGEYVFAVDSASTQFVHYTFARNGRLVDTDNFSPTPSSEYVWSDANQKMYFFRDRTIPNVLQSREINADGFTHPELEPGALGKAISSSLRILDKQPVRVSPTGDIAILGSGVMADPETLVRKTVSLANAVTDITWLGDRVVTVRDWHGGTQLQAWATDKYTLATTREITGNAHAIVAFADNRAAVVAMEDGVPAFTVIDENLNVILRPVPVALAGDDLHIRVGDIVALDGSKSFDPDNGPGPLTYQWSVVAGPETATLTNSDSAKAEFTADKEGVYELVLAVTDGEFSATDTLRVTVSHNIAPQADASNSTTSATVGRAPIILDGSTSVDQNGDPLIYHWSVAEAPEEADFLIEDAARSITSFRTSTAGSYTFVLTVDDGFLQDTTSLVVVVGDNSPPSADASLSSMSVSAGSLAELNGTRSVDLDDDPLTYRWRIVGQMPESQPTLINVDQSISFFSSTTPGTYVIELEIDDGLAKASDLVIVTVVNSAPVANAAGSDTLVLQGNKARLRGTGSTDAEGDKLTYAWSIIEAPSGSLAIIRDSDRPEADLTVDTTGTYRVMLSVSDGTSTDNSEVQVTFTSVPTPVGGDANGDGVVNFSDFVLLASHFGESGVSRFEGDFNGDDIVSFEDFLILAANFAQNDGSPIQLRQIDVALAEI